MIWDSFMFFDELDMLECRLVELEGVRDLKHVLVEATVNHQGRPKPLYFDENKAQFARWADRIVHVVADELPSVDEYPDPWAREHGQREWTWVGLAGAAPDDVVLHGDLDEIPTAVVVRNVRPVGFRSFDMAFHPFCVDWLHPHRWRGTVAARKRDIGTFTAMRDQRNYAPPIPNCGWHFSWVGSDPAKKIDAFCHPEILDRTVAYGLDRFREGRHVDGMPLIPVDGHPLPKWIRDGHCPDSWWRS